METEEKIVDTETPEQIEAAEEAAFEAGFEDRPETQPEELEKEKPEEKPEEKVEEKSSESQPEPTLIAGLTEDEIREGIQNAGKIEELRKELRKSHDRVYGHIGQLVQERIDKISAALPATISPQAREKMVEEFPELAEIMFDSPEAVPGVATKALPPEPVPENVGQTIEEIVAKATDDQSKKFELRLLRQEHSDYKQIIETEGWKEFVKTLSDFDQKQIETNYEFDFCSAKLTDFKKVRDEKQKKQDRLNSAITPKGNNYAPSMSVDEEEKAFQEGFNSG